MLCWFLLLDDNLLVDFVGEVVFHHKLHAVGLTTDVNLLLTGRSVRGKKRLRWRRKGLRPSHALIAYIYLVAYNYLLLY